MPVSHTSDQVREKYARAARRFDLAERPQEFLGMARLRRDLPRPRRGAGGRRRDGLEPAVLHAGMLEVARKKAEGLRISLAEALPFEDESFDTVVSSLSLCTFPDPLRALREMARVCRADGRILLLEHGRSDRERLCRLQDWREERAPATPREGHHVT